MVSPEAIDAYLAENPPPDERLLRYESALEKIAAGKRPDGTYNLSREACEQIAKEVLSWGR